MDISVPTEVLFLICKWSKAQGLIYTILLAQHCLAVGSFWAMLLHKSALLSQPSSMQLHQCRVCLPGSLIQANISVLREVVVNKSKPKVLWSIIIDKPLLDWMKCNCNLVRFDLLANWPDHRLVLSITSICNMLYCNPLCLARIIQCACYSCSWHQSFFFHCLAAQSSVILSSQRLSLTNNVMPNHLMALADFVFCYFYLSPFCC